MESNNNKTNDKYNAPFASTLRILMDERKVTQGALASVIGMKRQTVSQYANGISEPSYEVLVKIARYFMVSTDYLLGISGAATADPQLKEICDATGIPALGVKRLMDSNSQGGYLSKFINDCINFALRDEQYRYSSAMDNYSMLMLQVKLREESKNGTFDHITDFVPTIEQFFKKCENECTEKDYYVVLNSDQAMEFSVRNLAHEFAQYLLEVYRDGKH